MLRHIILIFIGLLTYYSAFSTHNRAGEITYRHIEGFIYEIKVVTCTKTSAPADREWLQVDWGDVPIGAELDSIQRDSIVYLPGLDAQRNVYIHNHTYAGPGVFQITMLDQNRNTGVVNIDMSVEEAFCVITELVINPFAGVNNSVILLNPPKERACLNKLWIHNPGAYDPDGDILQYSLITCHGDSCLPIPPDAYQLPDASTPSPDDVFTIDSQTGDVVWDVPPLQGEFNIAILIEEFRMVGGSLVKVGSVIRDMQIDVITCDNNPPEITEINDTCIIIGTPLIFNVEAVDVDNDNITLSAIGGPLSQVENQAIFNPSTGNFFWNPECQEVRPEPYYVNFEAEDDNFQIHLVDIESVGITVIAPAIENPEVEPLGSAMSLTWDAHECLANYPEDDYDNFSYKIYRRIGEYGYDPAYCETGVPAYTGYGLIDEITGLDNTSYIDDDNIFFGGYFCYMIVTCWPNGAQSIASEEFCAELNKDVPVITHVSVENTDISVGQNYIAWSPPTELDTLNFSGPYYYELYWSPGYNQAEELIYTSGDSQYLVFGDTTFTHSGIDTETVPNAYQVKFYSDDVMVAFSSSASSVFITPVPDDNELTIEINHQVPWENQSYEVFRYNELLLDFELIGTTDTQSYVDTGLVNNQEYCYYVKAIGTYGNVDIIDPLFNFSQEACADPIDLTPPCAPELTVEDSCEDEFNTLLWTNPNDSCSDDVIQFNLYYTAIEGEEFELIESFDNSSTDFMFNENGEYGSIAGCFYVTALDSLLPGIDGELNQNESPISAIICIDNCPEYTLPNIFTPNQDGSNDEFIPFPYKFIDSIDFKVFNRWGGLVFETTDPDIAWDGTHQDTGLICTDGVYYYTAIINTIRLSGIVEITQSGSIQLLGGTNQLKE